MIPTSVERDWEQLLGFRHFLRHAYSVDLDPDQPLRNVERLQRAVQVTEPLMSALLGELASREA